jgi:hypothetical protein
MVIFHTAELPHRIEYVCPVCSTDNHQMVPEDLANLSCSRCGVLLDGSDAYIEIIPIKWTAAVPHETIPVGMFLRQDGFDPSPRITQ